MTPFTVAVDFDHTLHNPDLREPGYRMGKPYEGARDAMVALRDLGAKIVVHTCRALPPELVDRSQWLGPIEGNGSHVADWLRYFDIPFDDVTALKPIADAYVDDKAVPFTGDWAHTLKEILGMRP